MKVLIVGVGYVGLVSAACLAKLGHTVIGVDINEEKITMLNKRQMPIYEAGLQDIVIDEMKSGRLSFKVGIGSGINDCDIAMIAVGTPERSSDGEANLFYISETAKKIAMMTTKKSLVVVGKSTVPVGTTQQIKNALGIYNSNGTEFHVGSNPETLKEGVAVHDFMNPDRIILGGDKEAQDALLELYSSINCPKVVTSAESAETIKLASNFMLALKLSTANKIAQICDKTGADIEEVMHGVGLDSRIGKQFLRAGIGYGGSCFPKDTKSIRAIAIRGNISTELFDAVININREQLEWFCRIIKAKILFAMREKKVAVWGVAFKPETDDVREAPGVNVIKWLLDEKAEVYLYDPMAMEKAKEEVFEKEGSGYKGRIKYCQGPLEAVDGADILIIHTEWKKFIDVNMERVMDLMLQPIVVDGRNIFDPVKMKEIGFDYTSIGR